MSLEPWNTWEPIGYMRSIYQNKNGTPRQGNVCPNSLATVTISSRLFTNPEHSLDGIQKFSHVWIIFVFHKNDKLEFRKPKISPPRLGGKRIGVFASRAPYRPNPIGLTLAKIENVTGSTLTLSGIDMIDGTPVLDIKPYIPQYDAPGLGEDPSPGEEKQLEAHSGPAACVPDWLAYLDNKPLRVGVTERASSQLDTLLSENQLDYFHTAGDVMNGVVSMLSADPRSIYRKKKCLDRLYYFSVDKLHVTAWFDDDLVEIVKFQLRTPKDEGDDDPHQTT